jgi:hypothetical protein
MSYRRVLVAKSATLLTWIQSDGKRHYRIIVVCSLLASLVFLLLLGGYLSGDSYTYIRAGQSILGIPIAPFHNPAAPIPPGYPFLLILTGVYALHTFWILLLLQAAMAFCMPILVYRTVQMVFPRAAFSAAFLGMISLIPYSFQKNILTDTPYMFFLLLAIYLGVLYWKTYQARWFYILLPVLLWAYWMRSAANLIGAIFVFFLIAVRPKAVFIFLPGIVGLGLATLATVMVLVPATNRHLGLKDYGLTGKYIFYNVYLSSVILPPKQTNFLPENGPATSRMIKLVQNNLSSKSPEEIQANYFFKGYAEEFLGRFNNDTNALAQAIFNDPNRTYFWLLWKMMEEEPDGNSLMMRVAFEKLKQTPTLGVYFIGRNLIGFFWGPPNNYSYTVDRKKRLSLSLYFLPVNNTVVANDFVTPGMAAEVAFPNYSSAVKELIRTAIKGWYLFFIFLRRVVFLSWMIGTVYFFWKLRVFNPFVILLIVILLYSAAVVVVFNTPLDRYQYQTFLLEIMLACIAFFYSGVDAWLMKRLKRLELK